jgi:imidazolonepropionase
MQIANHMGDLVIKNASELLTLNGKSQRPAVGDAMKELGIIENGAVAVSNGIIEWIGETPELKNAVALDESTTVIDAEGKLVMPGFVDPHTHLMYAGSREDELLMKLEGKSYLEILQAGGGILRTMRATRQAGIEKLVMQAGRRMDRMLLFGTTTAEAKSGYGLNLGDEVKMLEAIKELSSSHAIDLVPTFMGAHAVPPEFKDPGSYIDFMVKEVLPFVSERGLAEFADIFCEAGVFDAEQTERYMAAARECDLGLKIHADEIENLGGVPLACRMGAVTAEHLVRTKPEDMSQMAEAGVIACLLPGTPFVLMKGEYANARRMMEQGVAVALATDLNPNCWTESMQMIITLACLNMKMTPAEAINSATINAAHAIKRAGKVGSLEQGKSADIIVLDVPNHMHIPYHYGVNLVEGVIKSGRPCIP